MLGVKQLKEKVGRLAKGIFEYETPSILLSEEELLITVEAGKTYSDSFTIKNSKNTPIKGVLYSSCKLFELEQNSFTETENIIHYSFKADNMNAGEITKGEICIVSDSGELQLPYTINTEIPYFNSSIGKIKDLYNFANLAKSDWAEALKIFKSKEFHHLILHYETKYNFLYQNLLKSKLTSQALEEFLIAIHKKLRMNIVVNKTTLDYQVGKESFMDKLILTKDSWGYAEIRVNTDAPFISLEHKIVWSDNFVGNSYPLEFVLDPNNMRTGNNYGRIYLRTTHQSLMVDVVCHCSKGEVKINYNYKKIKSHEIMITENYLSFRSNGISLDQYVTDSSTILESMTSLDTRNQDVYHLLQTHLLIIAGKDNQAKQMLEEYSVKADEWKQSAVVTYCGYLYLLALLRKDESSIQEALMTIRGHYDREYFNWKLLWLLLYIDKKYDKNKSLKLEDIKKQYIEGCRSPILYFEAVTILNEEPALIHELGDFELQVLNWGTKRDYMSKEATMQFTYLAGKNKDFHKLTQHCLTLLYDKYKLKDTLISICSLLIKGHIRSNKFFHWYQLGVEEQLRITELHEYFLYSIDENLDFVLPQPILLYFIYNSNLQDRKKAFLYAYIVKNKDIIPSIYRTYYKRMEQYALMQIAAHNVSPNLSVLYDEIIAQQGLTPEIVNELPNIMFKYEISCNNPNMKGVFVVHKELLEEVYNPFVNGVAQIDIYTENAEILLVDGSDNRYIITVEYTLNKLMHWEDYINTCYKMQTNHPFVLLNLSEKAQNYQKFDEQSIEIRKRTLQIQGLNADFYKKNIQDLIFYYYDNFEGEQLEAYLLLIDLHDINKSERNKIVEFLIIRDLYSKAFTALEEFGFNDIAVNHLIKLCSNVLQNKGDEDSQSVILVNLSYYIFKAGKYNETTLKYLVKYFYGTTHEMFELWKTAVAFEMETVDLEERLLVQMLFAQSYIVNSLSVFMSYYKRGCNHKLIKAFLSYNAYKYLVKERIVQPELFGIMKKEAAYEENEVCMLALLKELSQKEMLTEGEIDLIDYNIHKFVKNGIVLPYYMNFQHQIALPPKLKDKFFIEYKTNPTHKVTLNYRIEGKNSVDEFVTEKMKNVYLGIHIKEFILFYNESIQYYIAEEDEEGQVTITESVKVQLDQNRQLDEDTKYDHINFMLTAIDMQDEKTLMDSISNYVKTNYVMSQIFKQI